MHPHALTDQQASGDSLEKMALEKIALGNIALDDSATGGYLDDEPEEDRLPPRPTETPSRFTFPAGARVGVALHYLLEHLDFTDDSQHLNLCQQTLERIGLEEDRAVWLEQLQAWLRDILQTPLLERAGLSLSALTASERLDELEFHFPVSCQGDLKALLKSNQHPGAKPLPSSIHLEGMMTGFIDLVFRHEGKYYLADYKIKSSGR